MRRAQISPQASSDIAKLAQGTDRVQVALEALKESKLTPQQITELTALLQSAKKTKRTSRASKSQPENQTKAVDGQQAVEGKIAANRTQCDTRLDDWSFGRSRTDQVAYALKSQCRPASREQNKAYVESLIRKANAETLSKAGAIDLQRYRQKGVRDATGGIFLDEASGTVFEFFIFSDRDNRPGPGMLLVKAPANSKK
jgi:hypothetical protein